MYLKVKICSLLSEPRATLEGPRLRTAALDSNPLSISHSGNVGGVQENGQMRLVMHRGKFTTLTGLINCPIIPSRPTTGRCTSVKCSRIAGSRWFCTCWWWASSMCSWYHAECRSSLPWLPLPWCSAWRGPGARGPLPGTQHAYCASKVEPVLPPTAL